MGFYNPHAPKIIGNEWVPIREEDIIFSPVVNVVELGHEFNLTVARTLQDARFYINTLPPGRALGQVYLAEIYQQGAETETGPIESVFIPCNAGLVSGGAVIFGTTSVAEAVADGSDNKYINLTTSLQNVSFFFATNAYANLLTGKRIVEVRIHYNMAANSSVPASNPIPDPPGFFSVERDSLGVVGFGEPEISESLIGISEISTVSLGELDYWWTPNSPNSTSERMPWSYAGLQRFEISTAPANRIRFRFLSGGNLFISYITMEVLFCEEARIVYGGKSFGEAAFVGSTTPYVQGTNIITMRSINQSLNPVLQPGRYSLVIASANQGSGGGPQGLETRAINLSQYPSLNGIREKYQIPSHPGVHINVTNKVGQTFTREETRILPQLSLHAAEGTLTEPHVYGRQAVAQVYGSITATQEIDDSVVPVNTPFKHTRYIARRFGDTTVPLNLFKTVGGDNVSITPEQFDVLPEIIDGWREVNVQWNVLPTMGGGAHPRWEWRAPSETAGNRWEVLGASAPALSGIPGNLLNLVPSPNQLAIATYGAPISGAQDNLGWVPQGVGSPPVSGTTDDQTSDAFIIFAQDPAIITGFGASTQFQTVTGIGLDCGLNPCCIPTALQYNQLTWPLPTCTDVIADTFTRTVSNGWGTSDSGDIWSTNGGAAANYSVNGTTGLVSHPDLLVTRLTFIGSNICNSDQTITTSIPVVATGNSITSGLVARFVDANNYYMVQAIFGTDGMLSVSIFRNVATVFTQLGPTVTVGTYTANTLIHLRFQVAGASNPTLKAKVWLGNMEPAAWTIETTDPTSALASGSVGTRTIVFTGNTNTLPVIFSDDNYNVIPAVQGFGYYEIQRMDTVETDWQTIMKATNVALTGFNDYEARVGILSSYRIRNVDIYEFAGPWTTGAGVTIPVPGVTIGCDDGHLLIFTSNEQQDGSINLAYSSVWESGTVEEPFAFPEASFVQLQAMYNRDFFTAFRPTERGGEQFERTILVQAAAIAPETLGDFTSLRDMAWADVSYICVRDEDGNRWLATVLVPGGRVLRDRRLYLAPVNVIEVTDTPSPVDP